MGATRAGLGKRITRAMWWSAVLFAAGFFPTVLLGNPIVSLAAAPVLVILPALQARTVRKGLLIGAGWGIVSGLTISLAMNSVFVTRARQAAFHRAYEKLQATSLPATQPTSQPATAPTTQPAMPRPVLTDADLIKIRRKTTEIGRTVLPATTVMCALVAGVFAHLGAQRRRRIEEEWG
jgi:hypothetical protein